MLTVKELKAFLADKPEDLDVDFIVTAIKWVVKAPEEPATDNVDSAETTVIDAPEEKAVEDELVD